MTIALYALFLTALSTQITVSHAHPNVHSDPSLVRLFARQNTAQQSSYPPTDVAGPTPRPEWVEALNRAKSAGRIPSFKPSTRTASGGIQYEGGGGNDATICSWTLGCRSPVDITDAPAGMFGVSFDDGPQDASPALLDFLQSVNQSATHFMIGSRILTNRQAFMTAVQRGGHLAVHTWSHPMTTTLSDEGVLGELGWTLQVIYDYSGGKLPAYWRPPYGDVDNRVRAIAKNVFGLQTVIWNGDSNDYCITPQDTNSCNGVGPANEVALHAEMSNFAKGSKTPGLLILEHESSATSVRAFTQAYTELKSAGWDIRPIPALFDAHWYQNAVGPFDQPIQLDSILNGTNLVNTTARAANRTSDTRPATGTTSPSSTNSSSAVTQARSAAKSAANYTFKLTTTDLMSSLIFTIIFLCF